MRFTKVVIRNLLVYWRRWRISFFLSVLSPVMFLSAMGFGLGSMIHERGAFGDVEYLSFFATGMLAASCMQAGVFSATYPIMGKIVWQKNYEALLATPLTVRDIFIGELAWIGVMLAFLAVPFFAVMWAFGIFESMWAVAAVPVVVLVGLSCASVMFAYTATRATDEAFVWIFRFIVTPLFLLSGTFFPITQLPSWGRVVAQLTPLFHGVELARQLTIYDVEPSALWHLGYLVALLIMGTTIGIRNLQRRLLP